MYSWLVEISRNDIRLESDGIFDEIWDMAAAFFNLSNPELPMLTFAAPCMMSEELTSLISLIILVNIVCEIH